MFQVVKQIVPAEQMIVVHAILEGVEWEGTEDHVRATTEGVKVFTCRARRTLLQMVEERGMFPSPKQRQCTSDLKRGPIEKTIRATGAKLIVNCMGMRAQESPKRRKLETFKRSTRNSKNGREWYDWLPVLRKVGFPAITRVAYEPTRAPYTNLEGKCLANETLPSLAYGGHSCSIVFKAEPQMKFLKSWKPALEAWAAGIPVLRAIGYDCSPADTKRRERADKHLAKTENEGGRFANCYPLEDFHYPLQEHGIDRVGCMRLIESAGLPVPMKSACFFCPASKKSEIVWLRDKHPELFWRAIQIEKVAREGKHGFGSVKGLGRNFAWADLANVKPDAIVEDAREVLQA